MNVQSFQHKRSMKSISILLITIIALTGSLKAQEITDLLLLKVTRDLPSGWTANMSDSMFTIEYKDSVWVAHDNWINAHEDHLKHKIDSVWIRTYGHRTRLTFAFRLVERMDAKSIEKLKNSDEKYNGQWARTIYNSQLFTLLQVSTPAISDQYTAVWPQKNGTMHVSRLLLKYLSSY